MFHIAFLCTKRRSFLIVPFLLCLAFFTGCGSGDDSSGSQGPSIVTSIPPLAGLARQLIDDHASVTSLLSPSQSPHGFSITPQQAAELNKASLVISIGLGLDDWMTDALQGKEDQIHLQFTEAVHVCDDDDHKPKQVCFHEGHDHSEGDPHVWLDPILIKQFLPELARALTEVLPGQKELIADNLKKLQSQLDVLDNDLKTQLSTLKNKKIITYHDAFDRFAKRYGLEILITLTPGESPGAQTPKRIADAVAAIKMHNLKAIFTEPQFAHVRNAAIDKTGVKTLILDPFGDGTGKVVSYDAMMRYNLKTLIQGLGD